MVEGYTLEVVEEIASKIEQEREPYSIIVVDELTDDLRAFCEGRASARNVDRLIAGLAISALTDFYDSDNPHKYVFVSCTTTKMFKVIIKPGRRPELYRSIDVGKVLANLIRGFVPDLLETLYSKRHVKVSIMFPYQINGTPMPSFSVPFTVARLFFTGDYDHRGKMLTVPLMPHSSCLFRESDAKRVLNFVRETVIKEYGMSQVVWVAFSVNIPEFDTQIAYTTSAKNPVYNTLIIGYRLPDHIHNRLMNIFRR